MATGDRASERARRVSIAIVSDSGLLAQTTAEALKAHGHTATLVDVHDDVVSQVDRAAPELAILDPDATAVGAAAELIEPLTARGVPVVLLSDQGDQVRRATWIAAGAAGVLGKNTSFADLLLAIAVVTNHGTLLDDHARQEHLAALRRHEGARRAELAPFEGLTAREAEVLGELVRGRTVAVIARDAGVSVTTVRSQVRAILRKLDVGSQVEAMGRARLAGWRPPQERGTS